jgi:short-subunit dehydrogenase
LSDTKAKIYPFTGDLSIKEDLETLFRTTHSRFGHTDIFIANAGIPYFERLESPDWDHISSIFQLNVFSTIYSFQRFKGLNSDRVFKFVIISSAMAYLAMPGYALYAATKAALLRFSEAVRLELDDPRKLMVVFPIATKTRFFKVASVSTPIPWPIQSPEIVAQKIVRGIQKDRKSVFPSRLFHLILFLDRFQPFIRFFYQKYYKRDLPDK